MKEVTFSARCLEVYPWIQFAYGVVKNLLALHPSDYLKEKQKETEAYIRNSSQGLLEKAKAISRFYKVQGEKNRSHIESLIKLSIHIILEIRSENQRAYGSKDYQS